MSILSNDILTYIDNRINEVFSPSDSMSIRAGDETIQVAYFVTEGRDDIGPIIVSTDDTSYHFRRLLQRTDVSVFISGTSLYKYTLKAFDVIKSVCDEKNTECEELKNKIDNYEDKIRDLERKVRDIQDAYRSPTIYIQKNLSKNPYGVNRHHIIGFDDVFSLDRYTVHDYEKTPIGGAIKRLKYYINSRYRYEELVVFLVTSFVDFIKSTTLLRNISTFIPAPSTQGNSLVADITRRIATQLQVSYLECLSKAPGTKKLKSFTALEDREKAIIGKIKLSEPESVTNLGVVCIVDDVLEYGTTLRESEIMLSNSEKYIIEKLYAVTFTRIR